MTGVQLSTIPKIDGPGVTTYSYLSCWGDCRTWPNCQCGANGTGTADSGNTKSEEVVAVGNADPGVTFVDALARLRSANAAFVAEVRRCYGEQPFGSPIKKVEYRVSDGSVAVIDLNGGLVTFSTESPCEN